VAPASSARARNNEAPTKHRLKLTPKKRRPETRRQKKTNEKKQKKQKNKTNSETYQYYSLPFCTPEEGKKYRPEDLGEVLEGDRLVNSPYDLQFATDVAHEELCTKKYSSRELALLRSAVENDYYFQMFLDDDLPVWGFIGKVERVPPKRAAALRAGGGGGQEEGGGADGGDKSEGAGGGKEEPRGKPHDAGAFSGAGGGERRLYLFTHFHFDVGYNGDRVIELNVSTAAADPTKTVDITAPKQPGGGGIALEPPREVTFSYSARWREVPTRFEDRMDRFSRYSFLPQHLEIHWFSIVNSCVTVLLLTGFLATILLRVLRADLVRYARGATGGGADDGGESGRGANGGASAAAAAAAAAEDDETGWKHLHGDVFRFPPRASLFASLVGAGTQLLLVAACVLALALLGTFYPYNRGAMMAAALVLYALTAGVAGYTAACWHRMLGGRRWAGNVLLTAALFCGPLFGVFAFANSVAWVGGSTQALPAGTIVALLAIWLLVAMPLTVLGGAAGKSAKGEYDAPCRTAKFPRQIPPGPWYRGLAAQMVMAGFLPFSAIYIGEAFVVLSFRA
jgi:hypothetical protein